MIKNLLFVATILLTATLCAMAADVSGKWTFEQEGRNGTMQVTLNLKAVGGALSGAMTQPGRDGNAVETPIADGKIDGNNISFTVTREFNDHRFVATYQGSLDGDSLKLEIARQGRDGNTHTSNVVAKRVK